MHGRQGRRGRSRNLILRPVQGRWPPSGRSRRRSRRRRRRGSRGGVPKDHDDDGAEASASLIGVLQFGACSSARAARRRASAELTTGPKSSMPTPKSSTAAGATRPPGARSIAGRSIARGSLAPPQARRSGPLQPRNVPGGWRSWVLTHREKPSHEAEKGIGFQISARRFRNCVLFAD